MTGTRERELWATVMQKGIDDANGNKDSPSRRKARSFISSKNGMFDQIANWLGFDADAARDKIKSTWDHKNI